MQRWAKILGKKGWLGWGWPKEFGGPGWNAIQKHLFEEETALAGAPRVVPFGPVMVAPVIMAFGTPEQQKRFLPGIAERRGVVEPGLQRAGLGLGSRLAEDARRAARRQVHRQRPEDLDHARPVRRLDLLPGAHEQRGQAADRHQLPPDRHEVARASRCGRSSRWTARTRSTRSSSTTSRSPPTSLIGEENKGWTYAKYLLAHERTNIADVNRAKRELERLKRIAKAEGVYDDQRFRDEIALLEVDVVALEMLVLRVLSAEKSGKQASTSPAC